MKIQWYNWTEMMKESVKVFVSVFCAVLCVIICSCSKSKTSSDNADIAEMIKLAATAEKNENNSQLQVEAAPKKNYLTMEEFINERKGLYEKGGIALYEAGEIYDVPEGFGIEPHRIFGVESEYVPPDEPYKEIEITFIWEDEYLHIMLPTEVYKKNPDVYLEAEHDGKTFAYNDKKPLKFDAEINYSNELVGYHYYLEFTNRNLYSQNDEWNITLKNCQNDEIIASKAVSRKTIPDNYVVYTDEYESPFTILENRGMQVDKIYHLIYKGKGGSFPDEGTMIVFSYCYYCSYPSYGIAYIPFVGVKTKTDKDGVCNLDFSIKEPGQYKIDFYDCASGEITRCFSFNYMEAHEEVLSSGHYKEVKLVEQKDTEWKVNSPEGLRLRDSPWGEKIGLLADGTELIQTEETHYPFYDFIDGVHGFWIPVQIKNKTEESEPQEKKEIYCNNELTDGWVFSGFLEK